jgi:hypothetical protein
MRGVGVKPVAVRRVTVFFFFIERTFTEAAEQTPRPKSGVRAGGRSQERSHIVAQDGPITDESWRLRVRGADGSRATSIRAGGDAPDTRDFFVKPGSERPFYTPVHR